MSLPGSSRLRSSGPTSQVRDIVRYAVQSIPVVPLILRLAGFEVLPVLFSVTFIELGNSG